MKCCYLVASLCLAPALAYSDTNPWSTLARGDILVIHDTLRDNHPGPPDPSNPHYRDWLEKGLPQALSRADAARSYSVFFFQAEDGIRDWSVTGVQTCALPI